MVIPCVASPYTPTELYNAQYLVLDNGLKLVFKQRKGAKNVSIRLLVNTGTTDFPCGKRETPHFLEHLLFAGTSAHSEVELEKIIDGHGGYWNATTNSESTIYEVEIYSKHTDVALSLLYEIMTTSLLSDKLIEEARLIVLREANGGPDLFTSWLYEQRVAKNPVSLLVDNLLPGSHYFCNTLESANDVTKDDILTAFKQYYRADNMVLVIVGDFEPAKLNNILDKTFLQLPTSGTPMPARVTPPFSDGGSNITGRLSPIFSDDANVSLAYRLVDPDADAVAIWFLENYLNLRLRTVLRIENQLTYSQEATREVAENFEVFMLTGNVDIDDTDKTLSLMRLEVEKLIDAPLSVDVVQTIKKNIFLSLARGYETNIEYADYYIDHIDEFETDGRLFDWESHLEMLTPAMIHAAVKRNLILDREVALTISPTLTVIQLYQLLGGLFFSIVILLFLYVRLQKKRQYD